MSKGIYKLLEKVLSEVGDQVWSISVESHAPKPVDDRVKKYKSRIYKEVWANASYDLLALIACLDLLMENKVKNLSRTTDQVTLQMTYGVNAFSREATEEALQNMQKDQREFKTMQEYCMAADKAALMLVVKQASLGPLNASSIGFEKAGYDHFRRLNQKIKSALDRRLRLLELIITSNKKVLSAHKSWNSGSNSNRAHGGFRGRY